MPLYEYICDACQQGCELLVRGGEVPVCPACGASQLKQQLSVVATPAMARRDTATCAAPPQMGCGLPACGGGRCAMSD